MLSHSLPPLHRQLVGGLLAIATGACQPPAYDPSPTSSRADATAHPSSADRVGSRLLAVDLVQAPGTTAADAIRALRPAFLQGKRVPPSTQLIYPSVYVDGQFAGTVEVLSLIPLEPIVEIRYVTAMAARTAFGSYCPCAAGVITVRRNVDAHRP